MTGTKRWSLKLLPQIHSQCKVRGVGIIRSNVTLCWPIPAFTVPKKQSSEWGRELGIQFKNSWFNFAGMWCLIIRFPVLSPAYLPSFLPTTSDNISGVPCFSLPPYVKWALTKTLKTIPFLDGKFTVGVSHLKSMNILKEKNHLFRNSHHKTFKIMNDKPVAWKTSSRNDTQEDGRRTGKCSRVTRHKKDLLFRFLFTTVNADRAQSRRYF